MTQIKPYIKLNRLVIVSKQGKTVYDEKFHLGVNILRGKNSSGKSTISNFLYYSLGGDYNNWTTEAIKCEAVYSEVEINGAVVTLKRNITDKTSQPMYIYWGNYEKSLEHNFEGWQAFPYKQTDNKSSFTNILFNLLEFPEIKSDADSNITMHQLLRLIYIDQDTPTQSLFRFERFDIPLTRQTISEVLLGVYDDSLYSDRLTLRNSKKDLEDKTKQYENLSKVFISSGGFSDVKKIQSEISNLTNELVAISKEITELRSKEKKVVTTAKKQIKAEKINEQFTPIKNEIVTLSNSINEYEIEVYDSKLFIGSLEKRISALEHSILTKNALGELPLTNCPQCLSPLSGEHIEGHCFLCNNPVSEDDEKTHAKRMKQEIELQVKESKHLLVQKESTLNKLKSDLVPLIEKGRALQRDLDISVEENTSTRDEKIDTLFVNKGSIENKIENLSNQIKTAELLELLEKEIAKLSGEIAKLELGIKNKIEAQKAKLYKALDKIQKITLELLKLDLHRQDEFRDGHKVEIDFYDNSFSLDNKFNFSASSNIYFKNSVRFAIFFASLELDFFRYPKFVFCDNMEDKGMEKERTQNFQKLIVQYSNKYTTPHQIIFSTSMIADELNNTDLCIGKEYDQNNKTLQFKD